jgi:hypothetical protein
MKTTLQNMLSIVTLSAAALLMAGCNMQQTLPIPVSGNAFQGRVYGGQQPVSGSSLQLYAVGSTGYGSAYTYTSGTSLLGTHTVTTNPDGTFLFTGDYTCPSPTTEVYLVSTGGNPGLVPAASNPNLALMAALGPCGSLNANTFINMNELTTVASVWALAPFMTGIANIGTSATNSAGLTNAFATVNKLVNTVTGTVPGLLLPVGATAPIDKINSLADILAACINSPGGKHNDGSACGTLFQDTVANGVYPTDTITAAMNMAQNPNQNAAALLKLATATAPFQPQQSPASTDLALIITHVGGGLSAPGQVAVDAPGNVWVLNKGNNSVTKLNNLGVAQSGSTGFTAGPIATPVSLAIDTSGNAWVANSGNGSVTEITSEGTLTNDTGANGSSPTSIVVDPQ